MRQLPMISVIVPVYGVEEYLAICIDSILNQVYTNFELLLVDDGSIDESGRICDKYAQCDERIRVFHKQNGGVSSARNLGLDQAKGDWITFVDADDWVEPFFLDGFLNAMMENSVDLIVYSSYIGSEKFTEEKRMTTSEAIDSLLSFSGFPTSLCLSMYARSVVKNSRLSPEIHFWEDFEFQYRMLLNASQIGIVSKPAYHYFMREGSANHSEINPKIMSCMKMPQIILSEGVITMMQKHNIYAYFIFQCMIVYIKSQNPNLVYRSSIIEYIREGVRSIVFSNVIKNKHKITLLMFSIFPLFVCRILKQKYQ